MRRGRKKTSSTKPKKSDKSDKMNIKIEITKIGKGFTSDEQIVEIDIQNGKWKYNDKYMETLEKIPITINTINKTEYLTRPVKDAYPFYDQQKALEEDTLIVTSAAVRTYDNLLTYLNCRIKNTKEEYKKYGWTERTYHITLFKEKYSNESVIKDITYKLDGLCEVKIKVA